MKAWRKCVVLSMIAMAAVMVGCDDGDDEESVSKTPLTITPEEFEEFVSKGKYTQETGTGSGQTDGLDIKLDDSESSAAVAKALIAKISKLSASNSGECSDKEVYNFKGVSFSSLEVVYGKFQYDVKTMTYTTNGQDNCDTMATSSSPITATSTIDGETALTIPANTTFKVILGADGEVEKFNDGTNDYSESDGDATRQALFPLLKLIYNNIHKTATDERILVTAGTLEKTSCAYKKAIADDLVAWKESKTVTIRAYDITKSTTTYDTLYECYGSESDGYIYVKTWLTTNQNDESCKIQIDGLRYSYVNLDSNKNVFNSLNAIFD